MSKVTKLKGGGFIGHVSAIDHQNKQITVTYESDLPAAAVLGMWVKVNVPDAEIDAE